MAAPTGSENLKPKAVQYFNGIMAGKTKLRAALDAGYSESTARSAKSQIEGKNGSLQRAIQRRCSADALAQKIVEGLDATTVKQFCDEGTVIEAPAQIDYSERRQYARLTAELGGMIPKEAQDTTVNFILERVGWRDQATPRVIDVEPDDE